MYKSYLIYFLPTTHIFCGLPDVVLDSISATHTQSLAAVTPQKTKQEKTVDVEANILLTSLEAIQMDDSATTYSSPRKSQIFVLF